MNTPSQEILQKYVADGLITERAHPDYLHIKIYNYTPECAFSRQWDEITMQCRGLIVDTLKGEVLARPFQKFFNYEEHIAKGGSIPAEVPIITEKLDGSLGILYFVNDEPWIATRGSFESDQALWATQQLRKKNLNSIDRDYTYLFEIIYPANKIVVNYDYSDIVLLAAIHTETGREMFFNAGHPEFRTRKEAHPPEYLTIVDLKEADVANAEGYVIHYPDAGLRLKIKFDTYCKLHKTLTGLSEIGVWELLQEKGIHTEAKELIQEMPDEFYGWLTTVVTGLQEKYNTIEQRALATYLAVRDLPTRKEQAIALKTYGCAHNIVFAMLDGRDYSHIIYKLIRPSGKKTFTQDTDV